MWMLFSVGLSTLSAKVRVVLNECRQPILAPHSQQMATWKFVRNYTRNPICSVVSKAPPVGELLSAGNAYVMSFRMFLPNFRHVIDFNIFKQIEKKLPPPNLLPQNLRGLNPFNADGQPAPRLRAWAWTLSAFFGRSGNWAASAWR